MAYCKNCVHKCEDHSLLDFISTVQYMNHFIKEKRVDRKETSPRSIKTQRELGKYPIILTSPLVNNIYVCNTVKSNVPGSNISSPFITLHYTILTSIGKRGFYMIMTIYGITNSPKKCVCLTKIIEQIPKTTGWIIRSIKIYTRFWIIKAKAYMSRNLFQKK